MTQDEQKKLVAREALRYIVDDTWLGVGSGSTANYFIDELAKMKWRIKGAIASSVKTAERLKSHGIDVEELNNVSDIPVYIDGADEVTAGGAMIKGGGGALTREKIVAAVAQKYKMFLCVQDLTCPGASLATSLNCSIRSAALPGPSSCFSRSLTSTAR